MDTPHREKTYFRVVAYCLCHVDDYGAGDSLEEALEDLQRKINAREAMQRAQTKRT